jgi:gliding motility-associated-like protein
MKEVLVSLLLYFAFSACIFAQVADFTIPDTICEDKPVLITNVQPLSAFAYEWSFCSGNAYYEPDGLNIGNPSQILNAPRFITLVRDSLDFYTFTTSSGNSSLLRCYFGNSLSRLPLSVTNFGNLGVFTNQVTGIQLKNDNGTWYGFVANGNNLVRLVFGSSPMNTPSSPHVIGLTSVTAASGLAIEKDGQNWVGLCTDNTGNKIIHLNFGLTLGNDPVETDLGNIGQLNAPVSVAIATENSAWYAFICNSGNSTLSRLTFGNSLLNTAPGGVSLPAISGLNLNTGITIINDCGGINGFVTNCVKQADKCVVHLVFESGLGGAVTGYSIENNGILNQPYGISEVARQGDTLYAFAANYGSSSITRMFFPSCSGSSQPFFTGKDPPAITYPDPGTYNVLLTVNEGSASQSSKCRNIVVVPKPSLSLGPDRSICQGEVTLLDAGTGDSLYAWSTGATTQAIAVDTSGTYWVHAVNFWNCEALDTIKVTVNSIAQATIDTTICQGLTYMAQNALQNTAGVYHDTLTMATGCDSVVTTNLQFRDCPLLIWFPNAFTPNGDGLNDFFRPVGSEITRYTMQIFDRWGTMIFMSNDIAVGWDGTYKGGNSAPDVYTYQVTFESAQFPGVTHRETGTFTLAK